MTNDARSQGQTVRFVRCGAAPAAASTLVAAWVFDELDAEAVSVRVEVDTVELGIRPATGVGTRARIAALLSEPRFAGWRVDPDTGQVPRGGSGAGTSWPDPDGRSSPC